MIPYADKMWSNCISHTLLMGIKIDTTTLENNLAVFCKVEHILTIRPSNPTTGCLL